MKRIGILTGGGDVPGLNAAIKAFVWRMTDEPCEIIGLRRGWASLVNIVPDASADNSAWILPLNRLLTRADRSHRRHDSPHLAHESVDQPPGRHPAASSARDGATG